MSLTLLFPDREVVFTRNISKVTCVVSALNGTRMSEFSFYSSTLPNYTQVEAITQDFKQVCLISGLLHEFCQRTNGTRPRWTNQVLRADGQDFILLGDPDLLIRPDTEGPFFP